MSSISFSGLASGLDTSSIITQLVALKQQSVTSLEKDRSAAQSEISSLGKLSSALDEFSEYLEDFQEIDSVLSNTASSSDEDIATVVADGEAARGDFSLLVNELAQVEKDRSVAFANADAEVTAGTLEIAVYGEDSISIEIAEGATLADVRNQINSAGGEFSATIVDSGSGAYLSITALKSGHEIGGAASDAITITETYSGSNGTALGLTEVQTAKNAQFEIDGLAVERTSNEVDDVIDGVTLNLKAKDATPVTISIAPDPEKVTETFQGLVDKYNSLMDSLDSIEDEQGALARRLRTSLQSAFSSTVSGLNGNYTMPASIGITTNPYSGKMELDTDVLEEVLASDSLSMARIFAEDDNGVADRLINLFETYTDSDGILDITQETLNRRVDELDSRIITRQAQVDAYETRLSEQFTALETLMVKLQQNESTFSSLLYS